MECGRCYEFNYRSPFGTRKPTPSLTLVILLRIIQERVKVKIENVSKRAFWHGAKPEDGVNTYHGGLKIQSLCLAPKHLAEPEMFTFNSQCWCYWNDFVTTIKRKEICVSLCFRVTAIENSNLCTPLQAYALIFHHLLLKFDVASFKFGKLT